MIQEASTYKKKRRMVSKRVGIQINMYFIEAEIWIGRKVENGRQQSDSKFGFRIQSSQLCKPIK